MRYGRLGFWYRLVVVVARPALALTTIREWSGQEHIPATGGVIIAANHVSYVDPMSLGVYVLEAGRIPKYLAKASLSTVPVVRRVFAGAHQIPVDRGTVDAAGALSAAVAALEDGDCVLIYPEGTVTRDLQGWPMRARTGVARLALATGVPVVPVAQWGPQDLWRYKARRPRVFPRTRVQVLAGEPVDLTPYAGRAADGEVLHEVTELIMTRITGQLVQLRGGQPPAVAFDPRVAA